jgi:hypothetical protein
MNEKKCPDCGCDLEHCTGQCGCVACVARVQDLEHEVPPEVVETRE